MEKTTLVANPSLRVTLAPKRLTGVVRGRTADSAPTPHRRTPRQVPASAPHISPPLTLSLPRSSSPCHLAERLESFSLKGCLFRRGPRGHGGDAWGSPMRLAGDSDTAGRGQMISENHRRRRAIAYGSRESPRPRLLSGAAASALWGVGAGGGGISDWRDY